MKIAITGVSGHIGNNLVRTLLNKKGCDVKGLVFNDQKALEGLDLEIIRGNIRSPETLKTFCSETDVVFHLAARISIGTDSYKNTFETNVEGTKNLIRAAKVSGVKKFIYFSSVQALDTRHSDQTIDETCKLALNSKIPYEKTKALAENWVLEQKSDDFEVVILSPASVIGPFDFKPSLMGQFLIKLYTNRLPALVSGGYNWVDVRDVVNASVASIEKGRNGERYILSGTWTTLKEVADHISDERQQKIRLPVFPKFLAYLGLPFIQFLSKISGRRSLYTRDSIKILNTEAQNISSEKAVKELGFSSRPLKETIMDSVIWFKENGYI